MAFLLAELKRRNVIRMAGLYLVGAWLMVQVAGTVLPMFGAPDWIGRSLVLILTIAFMPALVFAWVFELTPHGIQRDGDVPPGQSIAPQTARRMEHLTVVVLALAVGYFAFDKFVLVPHGDATRLAPAPSPATQAPAEPSASSATLPKATPNSIAVLAFDDLSPAHDQANFSDGMAEEILNALTRIKALRVIARNSSFQFQGRDLSPQQIGLRLDVAHVLQGSVRKQGDQLRITVALVQTADGLQQWSNSYDGRLADIFTLQQFCARDIATQLNAVLGDGGKQRLVDDSTANPDAYVLFVQAQTLVNARGGDSLPRAITMLQQATTLDPAFARAWSKLAMAYAVLPQYTDSDWEENLRLSDANAQRAIALDPDNAEAYAVLGYNHLSRRQYVAMVAPSERAIALDPNDGTARFWATNELTAMGRSAAAEAQIDHFLARDPANALALYFKSALSRNRGDEASAFALARRCAALGSPFGNLILSMLATSRNDPAHGADLFASGTRAFGAKLPPAALQAIYRGMVMGKAEHTAALQVLAAYPDNQWTPSLLLMLGESERSFATFEHHRIGLSDAYLDFLWQPDGWSRKARQSPAFQGFAQRIGLLAYWKANQWPDLCSPTPQKGPDAFTCR